MVGRLGRIVGTVTFLALGLATPIVVAAAPSPASADTVIGGCTIVANPTASNFTNCPHANLSGADLLGVDLDYANLVGANLDDAQLAQCLFELPPNGPASCSNATFEHATLTLASFTGAVTTSCVSFSVTPTITETQCTGADFSGATLQAATLSNTDLSDVDLSSADLRNADVSGATFVTSYSINGVVSQYEGTNLTDADLAGLDLSGTDLSATTLTGANLAGSQLDGANLSSITQLGTTVGGQLAEANLTGANLSGATFSGATLTGATFTGTILVPASRAVTATSQAGAVATWSTPASLPGATPGSCTAASGSTFPLFGGTVTCQVLDANGDVATGTFAVSVQPTTQYFTRVFLPQGGADLSSRTYLDAGAADAPGITKVLFELTGGSLSNQIIATATPTIFGWLAAWNTTSVPNGSYSLVSIATDADDNADTSSAVTFTVHNPAPATSVVLPANGAALSGIRYFDAVANVGVTSVVYELSGGPSNLTRQPIVTATPTYVGWAAKWDTTSVADGSYTLQSVASYAGGVSGTSAPVSFTVDN